MLAGRGGVWRMGVGEEAGYSEGAILGNWLLQEAGGT